MLIDINNKTYTIPDLELDKLIKNLNISKSDAIQVWLDDHEITTNEEQEELNLKAKHVKINHKARSEAEKPKKTYKKPKNYDKIAIINVIYNELLKKSLNIDNISIRNNEKYIDFTMNNVNYTINLIAHRKEKQF